MPSSIFKPDNQNELISDISNLNKAYVDKANLEHLNANNPHGITAAKLGAATKNDIEEALLAHSNHSNPHEVDAADINAASGDRFKNYRMWTECGSETTIEIEVSNYVGYKIIAMFSHNGRISGLRGYGCAREFLVAFSPTQPLDLYDVYNLHHSTAGKITVSKRHPFLLVTKTKGTGGRHGGIFSVFAFCG